MSYQKVLKKGIKRLYNTIKKTGMLERGDEFVMGISGGKDSLFMLDIMFRYNERLSMEWRMVPVYIQLNHMKDHRKEMEDLFGRYTDDYVIEEVDILSYLNSGSSICYTCSRVRKMLLFKVADSLSLHKIALAHTMDDVVETYIMNILFAGETSTFLPVQSYFNGRFKLIRPLYTFRQRFIMEYLKNLDIDVVVGEECRYAKENRREAVRRFLSSFEDEELVRKTIFTAMRNINRDYIPDI